MVEEMVGCCGRVKYVGNLYGSDRVYVYGEGRRGWMFCSGAENCNYGWKGILKAMWSCLSRPLDIYKLMLTLMLSLVV